MNPLSVIRSDALLDPRLQKAPAVYMTLAAITTFTTRAKDGYCYFKQETVAQKLGKTRQAVSQHLNKLAEWGYVEITAQNYRGFKSNNAYRIKYDGEITDASSPCTTTQADLAAKCSSINALKEKKALTRNEFMQEIDRGYKSDAFKDWSHLTETEIFNAAEACLDFYGAKGELPAGEPVYVLRHWIRGGVKKGTIRKADKPQTGFQESKPEIKRDDLPAWKQQLLERLGEKVFVSWIDRLEYNGNGHIYAPNSYFSRYVREQYGSHILAVLPNVTITHREKNNA